MTAPELALDARESFMQGGRNRAFLEPERKHSPAAKKSSGMGEAERLHFENLAKEAAWMRERTGLSSPVRERIPKHPGPAISPTASRMNSGNEQEEPQAMNEEGDFGKVRTSSVSSGRDVSMKEETLRNLVEEARGSQALGFLQLQALAFICVLLASGLVPSMDIAFVLVASFYGAILVMFVFPVRAGSEQSMGGPTGRVSEAYANTGILAGLFLPLAYVLGGFARGDQKGVQAAIPHLFLLSCQILTEDFISSWLRVSPPVKVVVSLIYNVRRMFTITDWLTKSYVVHAVAPLDSALAEVAVSSVWPLFGRCLAIANLVFWSYHLFAYLIPTVLPRAFYSFGGCISDAARGGGAASPSKTKIDPRISASFGVPAMPRTA
eukprot:TRINITY_DN1140_c0_g1_i1.p1 TRINITY_DN1140_c0_g1~~TRINITY_DN1140_c0_g1_i1.p1  ORF type:complete len:380 (-),score=52.65 TRINITY_DN1140_c0_g1_i1:707-1846(-)